MTQFLLRLCVVAVVLALSAAAWAGDIGDTVVTAPIDSLCWRAWDTTVGVWIISPPIVGTPKTPGTYTLTIRYDSTFTVAAYTSDHQPLYALKVDTVVTWTKHECPPRWGMQQSLDSVITVPLGDRWGW